jgi:hypothetical protein
MGRAYVVGQPVVLDAIHVRLQHCIHASALRSTGRWRQRKTYSGRRDLSMIRVPSVGLCRGHTYSLGRLRLAREWERAV